MRVTCTSQPARISLLTHSFPHVTHGSDKPPGDMLYYPISEHLRMLMGMPDAAKEMAAWQQSSDGYMRVSAESDSSWCCDAE